MVVYLDDILIYSNNLENHKNHVRKVLRCLQAHKLYMSFFKCLFHKKNIEFLGFILGPKGLSMDKQKVETIWAWLVPWCLKEVQSFLEFANFYYQFIYNYSDVIISLTYLTHKQNPWCWSKDYQGAFKTLKKVFATMPMLAR